MKRTNATHAAALDDARFEPANDDNTGAVKSDPIPRLRDLPTITMRLEGIAESDEARAFVDRLHPHLERMVRQERGRFGLPRASAAILYDVLRAASYVPVRHMYRPMKVDSFKGDRIGYWYARAALEAYEQLGLIRREGGNIDRGSGDSKGINTRFLPSAELIEELANSGLTPANRNDHFSRKPNARPNLPPIILNTAKVRRGNRMPKGKALPVDYTNPAVATMAAQVERINEFTANADFHGMEFVGFQRGFNLGDNPTFNWNKGGRLWDLQGGYQFESAESRDLIKINGEATVEVDIGSSHLSIFLALYGVEFDPTCDLYAAPGFDRQVIKRFVNLTLSERRVPTQWPATMRRKFKKKYGKEIDSEHLIEAVRDQCLTMYPILKHRADIDIDWSDLQFIESKAIIDAVDSLNQEYGVVALPVHDSLRVEKSFKELAIKVLKDSFFKHVGIYPKVS